MNDIFGDMKAMNIKTFHGIFELYDQNIFIVLIFYNLQSLIKK